MYHLKSFVVVLTLSLATAGDALGGLLVIPGDVGDGTVDVNGLPQDFSLTQLRPGVGGNNVRGLASIFFFALPDISSPATLVGATLRIQFLDITRASIVTIPEFNVDLFGLGARSSPTILCSDYFDGDSSLSSDTLIAKSFITPSTSPGSLSVSGGTLLSFLTSLYNPDGTPIAAYVVFRANPDVHLPEHSGQYRGYELASADNADSTFVPRLDLNIVTPEPASIVSLSLGILALAGASWRRANFLGIAK